MILTKRIQIQKVLKKRIHFLFLFYFIIFNLIEHVFYERLKTFCEHQKDINDVNKAFNSGNVSYIAGHNEHSADVKIIYFYLINEINLKIF
jgi:hypothetical protein